MKNILMQVNSASKHIFILGSVAVALTVAASAVLYFGAGTLWDYYACIAVSEKLLALSRPVSVTICATALLLEYRSRNV
ncbi:MAG: hypothetical protein J6J45_06360 [Clostridia bacterium]|nr:hypothetical protein [Clostridia bacterium]